MFSRRKQDPDALDVAERAMKNATEAIAVGTEMAETISRLLADQDRLGAELAAARAEAETLRVAVAPIISGYSVANWSDIPDGQMTSARISHGHIRALVRGLM